MWNLNLLKVYVYVIYYKLLNTENNMNMQISESVEQSLQYHFEYTHVQDERI